MIEKNNPKIINAWCIYDWANSVYSLSITTTVFPVYYSESVRNAFGGDMINFFGFTVKNTVLYSMALSFSFLVVAFILPLLSGIADYGSRKKTFMKFFAYLGSFSCAALYFFTGKNVEYGILFSVLASIGFAGSLVFYNSYLPDIATPEKYDAYSAKGFSAGYTGSVILLVINLINIIFYDKLGFHEKNDAIRFTFLTVGIWWFGFSQITFHHLPDNIYFEKSKKSRLLTSGFKEIIKVFRQLKTLRQLKIFLISFYFYIMGVITVIYMSTLFASTELGMTATKLIIVILVLQLVAIAGAQLFAFVSGRIGNKMTLIIMISFWVFVCTGAYLAQNEYQFYVLAFFVGLVMGGIQSLSRSTYSKLIPGNTVDTASFFSFYDVTEKLATVSGTFVFGLINLLTGNMRLSALALSLFFITGLLFIFRFKFPHAWTADKDSKYI